MGGWKLEVARMAMYVTFPVALFHYFNQPELFEEWVIKTKRIVYPPEQTTAKQDLDRAIKKLQEKQDRILLQRMENDEVGK